jgi:parvulin-like peptidyl-prolyl isomerase
MLETYYHEHAADYQQATIKAIFISFKPQVSTASTSAQALEAAAKGALAAATSARSEDEARTLAEDIVKRLRAGEDFVMLVEEFSDDLPSKRDRGNMGVVNAGSKYPADFRMKVLSMEPGEVGDPIRQPTGFYIVRVEDKTMQSLSSLRADIIQTIRQEHLNQWFIELNTRFRPEITDPNIMLGTQPQAPGR